MTSGKHQSKQGQRSDNFIMYFGALSMYDSLEMWGFILPKVGRCEIPSGGCIETDNSLSVPGALLPFCTLCLVMLILERTTKQWKLLHSGYHYIR